MKDGSVKVLGPLKQASKDTHSLTQNIEWMLSIIFASWPYKIFFNESHP